MGHGANDAHAGDRRPPAYDRFVAAFRVAPIGMLLLDGNGRVLEANDAAASLLGTDAGVDDVVGRDCAELLHPEDRSLLQSWLAEMRTGDTSAVHGERRLLRPDGDVTWVQMSTARLPGDPPGFVVHLVDTTERRATEARLAHQALHDPLTGLPNRALLFDRLAQAVRAAWRGGPGVTVLYLDVDEFKAINDTRGHAVGDRVLQEVADRLRNVLRPADTVARLGGDEFAVVAEGLPPEAATELAERVAAALNGEPLAIGGGERLPVVASIGLAHSSDVVLEVDALINAADAAMYRDKQQRRRR